LFLLDERPGIRPAAFFVWGKLSLRPAANHSNLEKQSAFRDSNIAYRFNRTI
jgi:hypothetical protein